MDAASSIRVSEAKTNSSIHVSLVASASQHPRPHLVGHGQATSSEQGLLDWTKMHRSTWNIM